jgi:hypothetical protein
LAAITPIYITKHSICSGGGSRAHFGCQVSGKGFIFIAESAANSANAAIAKHGFLQILQDRTHEVCIVPTAPTNQGKT